jgi:hypothetical protein
MIAPSKSGVNANQVISTLVEAVDAVINLKKESKSDAPLTVLFDRAVIMKFQTSFQDSQSSNHSLSSAEFKSLLREHLPDKQVEDIYQKIDVNGEGEITFPDFMNFLVSSEAGSNWANSMHSSKLTLRLEQADGEGVHKDMIDHVCFVSKPMPMIITGGRDGNVTIWDPVHLHKIASIHHKDKNSVFVDSLIIGASPELRAKCFSKTRQAAGDISRKEKAPITSMTVMPKSGHLVLGAADSSVAVHDLGTQVSQY